jgi:type IV pilus assembly protein PilO
MNLDVRDPKVIRWLLVVVAIVIIVPAFFLTTVFPFTYPSRSAEIQKLEDRHQALSRDLEKARLLVRNLERVEKEYETLHQQWQISQTLLPETNEMPNLLRKVTAAGQQSGVEFEVFRPKPPVQQAFYADNPIEVKVRGGYHQTGVFLSRLANLNRIVNVSNLMLKGLEINKDEPSSLETGMTLTAYTLGGGGLPRGPEGQDPQLAATKKKQTQPAASH